MARPTRLWNARLHNEHMENVWVPIAIALLGNGMTLVVLLLSNRNAQRNEQARQEREDGRLEKSRHDLRVQLAIARDERLVDLRKGPYVECFQVFRETSLAIHSAGYAQEQLPSGWQLPAYQALLRLEVFAEWETRRATHAAYSALYAWGAAGPFDYESEQEKEYDAARDEFLIALRHDLRIQVDENRLDEADIVR